MKNFILTLCLPICLSAPVQALDVGNISSFMNKDISILSKEIKNTTDTGRLISINIERLSSPLDDAKLISTDMQDELLLTPARLALPAKSSDVVRFIYKGPVDDKERYYRINWLEQAFSDTHLSSKRSGVVTNTVRIGTILVVTPRKAKFSYRYIDGKLVNTGNATMRILAYGPCLKLADGKECKENYFLMPGKERRFTHVNLADNKGRLALWQGEQFIQVK